MPFWLKMIAQIYSRACLCGNELTPMVMVLSMRMKKRLSGNRIENALIAIMTVSLIEMKDGIRADGLIALKIAGTAGKTTSIVGKTVGTAVKIAGIAARMFVTAVKIAGIAGKMCVTAGEIGGTAARINGTSEKIGGIAKKMFANLKEIGGSTEGMYRAMAEAPAGVKASVFALASFAETKCRGTPEAAEIVNRYSCKTSGPDSRAAVLISSNSAV
jgi:hypothetical protein